MSSRPVSVLGPGSQRSSLLPWENGEAPSSDPDGFGTMGALELGGDQDAIG